MKKAGFCRLFLSRHFHFIQPIEAIARIRIVIVVIVLKIHGILRFIDVPIHTLLPVHKELVRRPRITPILVHVVI